MEWLISWHLMLFKYNERILRHPRIIKTRQDATKSHFIMLLRFTILDTFFLEGNGEGKIRYLMDRTETCSCVSLAGVFSSSWGIRYLIHKEKRRDWDLHLHVLSAGIFWKGRGIRFLMYSIIMCGIVPRMSINICFCTKCNVGIDT